MTDRLGVDLDKLTRPFPDHAIQTRQGGGNASFKYVEGHTVIHRLNDATGNCWDFDVVRLDSLDLGNGSRLLTAQCRLTIPGLGSREHIGVQKVSDRSGEDLAKGAITDALKKAATLFGIGLELYGSDYEAGEDPPARATPPSSTPPRPVSPGATERVAAPPTPPGPKPAVSLGALFGDMERAGVNKEDAHPMAHDIGCAWFDVESLTDLDHEQLGRMRRLVQTKPVEELYEKWKVAKLKREERQTVDGQLAGMPQPVREYGS